MKYKNKGDVLIFENEDGASEFFFTSDLKQMFEDIKQSKEQAARKRTLNMGKSDTNFSNSEA